jgi:hypothetical protein
MKLVLVFLTAVLISFWSSTGHAERQKILVKVKSCDNIKVKVISGSECLEEDFISGPCADVDECICISPEKDIKWRIVSKIDNKIKLKFKDETGKIIKSPFKRKCLDDFENDKVVCKMKTKANMGRPFYDFFVKVKGCETEHDPRIVIRGH